MDTPELDLQSLIHVPEEITSYTLTTKLKGICKINRLIDYSNQNFNDPQNQMRYQGIVDNFRDWIFKNKIIEQIFGPNCHVEIIKQSHTILNFVAYSLNDGHVDVIWSATLLKHCGRQVLDLLTSLVRFMRTGPVIHLYNLVKNLSIEDHSEHTLALTSHILRFIWSHSPCINQIQDTQKNENEWFGHFIKDGGSNFLDNTSDVSACCSEDKNMDDFDDEISDYIQDENLDDQCSSTDQLFHIQQELSVQNRPTNSQESPFAESSNSSPTVHVRDKPVMDQRDEILGINDSTSNSRDSDTKFRFGSEQNFDNQYQNLPLESIAQFKEFKKASCNLSAVTTQFSSDEDLRQLAEYNLGNLSEPGKTLLWDMLQDEKIEQLSVNLHLELENVLVNLVMSFGDRYIRYRFIEACLENLSVGTSVIVSLRLLPKLMSFTTITRNLSLPAINETHAIVLWAEREYNMSQNFFKNLVDYYRQRQQMLSQKLLQNTGRQILSGSNTTTVNLTEQQQQQLKLLELEYDHPSGVNGRNLLFSHFDKIITRMSFMSFIYSKPFSPESMKLTREQMDQLWGCLATDSNLKCSDVLFQWIYQQAVGDDFHGFNDELLDYVLKHKLPTLEPQHFRLRGLKLLEQLLWIRQDFECCHGLEHPATRLLWDIGLKAIDDEVSMAAIRILNHFYIYTNHQKSTKCDKGINFMNHCMEQLHLSFSVLSKLDASSNKLIGPDSDNCNQEVGQVLDVLQKVILLIRTHLEVFKAHWSYYLRILQLNSEADLISHRLSAYEIKLTMSIRIVCQSASSMAKMTIEMQAGDFVGELRAEIVKWWYSQVDTTWQDQLDSFSSQSSCNSSPSQSPRQATSPDPTSEEFNDQCKKSSKKNRVLRSETPNHPDSLNSFTDFLLANHHSLRLLSQNQEIPFDWDERQINELDFKDMQVVYVLSDALKSRVDPTDDLESDKSNESNQSYSPLKTELPSVLLLRWEYFERLMEAGRLLGSFRSKNMDLTNRAKALSRRIWEIIQILPTCPYYREDIKRCGLPNEWRLKSSQCSFLLSADCPQRLLYSLQIIDILKAAHDVPEWGSTFIRKGGLADLYDVFMSQNLLPENNDDWNEWLQECLAYLLKLLIQFGTKPPSISASDSSSSPSSSKMSLSASSNRALMNNSTGSVKRIRTSRTRISANNTEDRLPIHRFSEDLLELLGNTETIFNKLIRILESSALCRNYNDHCYYVTMSSRAMIVHHVMSFLASWCKSDPKFPKFQISKYEELLKALILNDSDSSTRREACNGFFKLHHATCSTKPLVNTSIDSINSTLNSSLSMCSTLSDGPKSASADDSAQIRCDTSSYESNWTFSADLLKCLIKFLPITESMRPPKPIRNYLSETDYIRELNSPGCKDYFWLTCRLIDSPATTNLDGNFSKKQSTKEKTSPDSAPTNTTLSYSNELPSLITHNINLYNLCEYLAVAIRNRQTYETRDNSVEDDTLRGMLLMMVMALKRDSTFRYTQKAFKFVHELYSYLFAPPTQHQRYLPKCKSPATRSTAFDLMISLVERCPKNYFGLLDLLLVDQHNSVVKGAYPNDYWPHDDSRSEVGFVGLINLGATCYLATCMQHLFMIPTLRYAILSIEDTRDIRHGEIIRELQKIFTFMLESERKAYNPRNFCKVYTMDNHPLNIAEQTDMTEFLTDLITKIEESTPELRQVIKGIFSGTLSNNVVSLGCPHVSRTTEEFYTLRVQVADMRSLNDSLDELTVKDTLEGDNMYTCSTCEKKVRAEKRACIVKLPRILCFNTMRYTFNMATMTKEKVNTHFSFPLKLDMTDYLEENYNLPKGQQSSKESSRSCSADHQSFPSTTNAQDPDGPKSGDAGIEPQTDSDTKSPVEGCHPDQAASAESYSADSASSETDQEIPDDKPKEPLNTMYELIGVTVHTGNADGGHYYCFVRDCEDTTSEKPRWYLFNDAEVKPFDDSHIGNECYGGELTTKSYDAINDRFMDFSIEKTNSAYMLFYKRIDYNYRSKSVALRYLESDTQRGNPSRLESAQLQSLDSNSVDQTDVALDSDGLSTVGTIAQDSSNHSSDVDGIPAEIKRFQSRHSQLIRSAEIDFNELSRESYENFQLPKHLAEWIWSDNMKFARDKSVFEHNYFNFMWQICANIPKNLNHIPESVMDQYRASSSFILQATSNGPVNPSSPSELANDSLLAQNSMIAPEDTIAIRTVHLAITFVLGVLMNSRERPNLTNWTELIRKQFNSSKAACDWLMHLIDDEETWLKQMLLRCPIEMVRQLFQRLCNDLNGSSGGGNNQTSGNINNTSASSTSSTSSSASSSGGSGSSNSSGGKQHKKLRLIR